MSRKYLTKLLYARLNVILSIVLAMLGFSNCDNIFNGEYLYGSPYVPRHRYDVKGTVLDEEDHSLEGLTVTVKEVEKNNGSVLYSVGIDQKSTDSNGQYRFQGKWNGSPDSKYNSLRIVVTDPHGVYAADSADVKLTLTDEGKNDVCVGTDVGTADFRLKRLDDKAEDPE